MKKIIALIITAMLIITALPFASSASPAVKDYTAGPWEVTNTSVKSTSKTSVSIYQLGEGGDFSVNYTCYVDRTGTANNETGVIFGMKDLNSDGTIALENDECFVVENISNTGRFGLAKVSGTGWTGWVKDPDGNNVSTLASQTELLPPQGAQEFTLSVSGSVITFKWNDTVAGTVKTLLTYNAGADVTGAFGFYAKKTVRTFNGVLVEGEGEDIVAGGSYGGSWSVDGSTYTNATVPSASSFAFYALGNTDAQTTELRLEEKITLGAVADQGFMLGVSNTNKLGIIEQNADTYYLVSVTKVTNGKFNIFIERNDKKWCTLEESAKAYDNEGTEGDVVSLAVVYDTAAHSIKVMLNGEQKLDWTDSSDAPFTGTGYGIVSKVPGAVFTDVSAVKTSRLGNGTYYQTRKNALSPDKIDIRVIIVISEADIANKDKISVAVNMLESGGAVKTINKDATTVYSTVSATGDGYTDRYEAANGSVIFGIIVTGAPAGCICTGAPFVIE